MADPETLAPLRFPGGGPTHTVLPDGTEVFTDKKGYVVQPDPLTKTLRAALVDKHGYVDETAEKG